MKKYLTYFYLLLLGSLTSCSDECKTFGYEVPKTLTPNLQNKLAGLIENSKWTLVSTQGDTLIIEALEPYQEIVKKIQYGNSTECSQRFEADRRFHYRLITTDVTYTYEIPMIIYADNLQTYIGRIPSHLDTRGNTKFQWSYQDDVSIPENYFSFADSLRLNDTLYKDVFYLSDVNLKDTNNGFSLYNPTHGFIALNITIEFNKTKLFTLEKVEKIF